MLTKKDLRFAATILFFIAAVLVSKINKEDNSSKPLEKETTLSTLAEPLKESTETYKVRRVIDGDTIELENGQKVRYIGIDTPETVSPNKPDGCFGKEASNKNRDLVEGKEVKLEKDVNETDRYGRLLRYVYVNEVFVNEYLVKNGYAFARSYPPDINKQEQLKEAEKSAREGKKGMWSSCSLETSNTK